MTAKPLTAIALAAATLGLAGCGGGGTPATQNGQATIMKAATVLCTTPNDGATAPASPVSWATTTSNGYVVHCVDGTIYTVVGGTVTES